jgi:signal transduction histidine kinase
MNLPPPPSTVQGGRRLAIARAVWLAMSLLAVALFVAGLPLLYEEFRTLSISDAVDRGEVRANLARLRLSLGFYAGYYVALAAALAAACFALAVLIFRRKSNEPMALFVALALVLLGATFSGANEAVGTIHPVLKWMSNFLELLSGASLFLFFYVFPDGRFVPRWTRWPALLLTGGVVFMSLLPDSPFNLDNWPQSLYAAVLLGMLFIGLFAQTYRYRRVSSPPQRQQTKWVVFGFAVALVGFLGLTSIDLFFPSLQPGTLADFVITVAIHCFMFVIPLSLAIAILRYRLWDIDIIVNRTLVYGTLTASVVGLYVLVVGGLGALFHAEGNLAGSLVAAGVVAVLFAPLRVRLQRGVNRLMYGERDDPYAVLSRLGRRLETTLAPEAALESVAEAVSQALKVPYTAIELGQDGDLHRVSEHGTPIDETVALPLVHQREEVGRMLVSPRAPGEKFSPEDTRLLEDLARQAGAAAHEARLSAELRRSRERLVSAREEERRRLRRDLHDGLGPTLGGLTLGLDAARSTLPQGASTTDVLLRELKAQTQEAVSDIRRLAHGLRPPALDDLGLVPAIRQQAAKHGHLSNDLPVSAQEMQPKNGTIFSVEAPDNLPSLPAAVEVACYRIIQEAIANVSRHAKAGSCHISLAVDEARDMLVVGVTDDGIGIPEGRRAGVGMASMRERAEELGGALAVERNPEGGTRVVARLPLPQERKAKDAT